MAKLTEADKRLLTLAAAIDGWYVNEDHLVSAGRLVERGLLRADSDYDGLQVFATEAGERAAKRLGLIRRADPSAGDFIRHHWERTEEGLRLTRD